jgi:hypothetical protein
MSNRATTTATAKRPAFDVDRARVSNTGRALTSDATGRGWSPDADSASSLPTLHSFGGISTSAPAGMTIGRCDDQYEAAAERAAEAVIAGNGASEAPAIGGGAPRVQARAVAGAAPQVTAELPRQMQAAATEGRALPTSQRTFYEDRLGHDFGAVRIHAGPAAAAAASSVQAQAFAHGSDVYFGENFYQPDSPSGQRLIAHELAHTVQQRPNVIARRALDGSTEGAAAPGSQDATSPQSATPASADVAPALTGDSDGGPAAAPPTAAVAPLLASQAAASPTTAAAARMQMLVRTSAGDAAQSSAETSEASEEGGGAQSRGGAAAAADASETGRAAQAAMATFDAQLAELSGHRSSEIRFQEAESGSVEDPERRLRREQSTSLASAFLRDVGAHVELIIAPAKELPSQLLAGLTGATGAITAAGKTQTDVVRGSAEASRQKVKGQTSQTRGLIERKRKENDQATAQAVQTSRDKSSTARDIANKDIDKHGDSQAKSIATSYRMAVWPMQEVGETAGDNAKAMARRKADAWLAQRNGESSLLDGALHDNRIEAAADAAVQVGDEYAKSLEKSANEQAAKLPESKPEVLGKVTEITGQAKKGLDDQFKQIADGADAFAKSSAARTGKVAGDFRSAAGQSGTQTAAAISAAEEQQAGEIAAFSATQSKALDQSVASGIDQLADGVTQTADGLMESMDDFVASARSMAPPDPQELSSSLGDVMGQTAATAGTMGAKIQTIGPTMSDAISTGRDQSVEMLTKNAASAVQQIDGTRESFNKGAVALNQQTVSGFDKLGKGDQKAAQEIGTRAESGFADASRMAAENFTKFGEKVEENFAQGRHQVLASLWSNETKGQLNADMRKYGQEAADQVQPRWKKVLKWVITIVVIIAVIAITVATAGALGPVGVVLLGAALGAAAGAVTTIANNLIDGKKWSDGVAKAMIVGAIGGAVGGAGGVILKGVGSVALKIGLEAGINVVGGVVSEVVGSLAVGETVNWTGAIMGALIGAGIGAGLGIAGALKGKIRFGGMGEAPPAPKVKPQVEVPPPSGRVRAALERAKILAPRPGAVPEAGVGVTPQSAPKTESRIGTQPEPVQGVAKAPAAPAAAEPAMPSPETTEPPTMLPEPTVARPQAASVDAAPAGSAEPGANVADAAPRESGVFARTEPPVAPTGEGAVTAEPTPSPAPDKVRPIGSARRARAAIRSEPAGPPRQAEPRVADTASQPSSNVSSQPEPRVAPSNEGGATQQPRPQEQPGRGKLHEFDPAQRGRAGPQPELKSSKPLTSADEFAARRAAQEAPPPEAQPKVQEKPLAMVSGVKSQAQVVDVAPGGGGGGTGENIAGGRNPVEPQAVNKPPGGGQRPPSSPAEGGGSSRSQVSEPTGQPSPKRGSRGTTTEAGAPPSKAAKLKLVPAEEVTAASVKPGEGGAAATNDPATQGAEQKSAATGKSSPKRPRPPPTHLPEYPQFPEGVGGRDPQESLDFFAANKSKYPKRIQNEINAARPGSAADAERIDGMIREAQTLRGNKALGYPAQSEPIVTGVDASGRPISRPSSPFTTTTKGHSPLGEGTSFERGFTLDAKGRPKNLTYEGVTHDGERVQIDDFDFKRRVGSEIKMPLALKNDPRFFAKNIEKVVDQMRRQAKFSQHWGFGDYEWKMFSPEDVMTAEKALGILASRDATLAEHIKITTIY